MISFNVKRALQVDNRGMISRLKSEEVYREMSFALKVQIRTFASVICEQKFDTTRTLAGEKWW